MSTLADFVHELPSEKKATLVVQLLGDTFAENRWR